MADSIDRLFETVSAIRTAREGQMQHPRTAKLFREGLPKIAKKMAEEAIEVGLDAVQGHRGQIVAESADLLYNLVVLWAATDVSPDDVRAEMDRREKLYGIAEKLPKNAGNGGTSPENDSQLPLAPAV
jgi:phosphoribosyl-ATP pyrophosphohydrolase